MTEEQRIAELMKPRYLAISPNEKHYPGSFWKVGDIIDPVGKLTPFDDYPHLFKRLEWWEDRKPEEMPEYVKNKEFPDRMIIKIRMHFTGIFISETGAIPFINDNNRFVYKGENVYQDGYYVSYYPATLAEYQQYINSKHQP